MAADMIGDQIKNNLIPKKEGESDTVIGSVDSNNNKSAEKVHSLCDGCTLF